MNKSLLANIEVDSPCVWVDLVDVMIAMVDQVLLQVSKPESGVSGIAAIKGGNKKYLQYSITTNNSLFFRLVVHAPRRLTMLRCLQRFQVIFVLLHFFTFQGEP